MPVLAHVSHVRKLIVSHLGPSSYDSKQNFHKSRCGYSAKHNRLPFDESGYVAKHKRPPGVWSMLTRATFVATATLVIAAAITL